MGCTLCECGVPGACLQEELPAFLHFIPLSTIHYFEIFLLPLLTVLLVSLLARWSLGQLLRDVNLTAINTISVFLGSIFIWPKLFFDHQFSQNSTLGTVILSVIIIYTVITFRDWRKNHKSWLYASIVILLIIAPPFGRLILLVFILFILCKNLYLQNWKKIFIWSLYIGITLLLIYIATFLNAVVLTVVLIYTVLTFQDWTKKKISLLHSAIGIFLIIATMFLANSLVANTRNNLESHIDQQKRTSVLAVIKPLGLLEKSDEIVQLLKAKNFAAIGEYINPDKKIGISFNHYRDKKFNKLEFLDVVQTKSLSKVDIYNNGRFKINAEQVISAIIEILNSEHEIDYYVDAHNFVLERKNISSYSSVSFLYKRNWKFASLYFSKSDNGDSWYLSGIKYSGKYPGY